MRTTRAARRKDFSGCDLHGGSAEAREGGGSGAARSPWIQSPRPPSPRPWNPRCHRSWIVTSPAGTKRVSAGRGRSLLGHIGLTLRGLLRQIINHARCPGASSQRREEPEFSAPL